MEKTLEKEGSKRLWPWKRKSSDKTMNDKIAAAASEPATSPHSSRVFDDQQRWDYHHHHHHHHHDQEVSPQPTPTKAIVPHVERNTSMRVAVDDVRSQWLQAEERSKQLNERLSTAFADITAKDNLVKQHVKVAEEAVTGWEKAEAEAVALKAQLDSALQQKLATEDRVAHLDGALKECVKQLRHVREEQEQRIHDTLVKKTREYDKLRMEMEAKMTELTQLLTQSRSELLESRAEVTALSHALQDRSRGIAETNEAKGRAEKEIKVLQVRLETVEKENSQLKYEVHVLNKELEIRSQEREYERKAVDVANKQHLESVKKVAKLEEECTRLRLLVQKKLPGPAAVQRMRMEVEGMGKISIDKRRTVSRSNSSIDQAAVNSAMQENANGLHSQEAQMLAERVVAMDEEMKKLKLALAQRNGELQSARLMCSKTASQLSIVEDELKKAQQQNGRKEVGTSGKEVDFLRKGRPGANRTRGNRRDSQNFDLMDDFAEMEQLTMCEAANLITSENSTCTPRASQEVDSSILDLSPAKNSKQGLLDQNALASKGGDGDILLAKMSQELEEANQMCKDLRSKLYASEQQISVLQARNVANEASLISLQDQLDLLNEAREQDKCVSISMVPPSYKRLSGYTMKDILNGAKKNSRRVRLALEDSSSDDEGLEEHASNSDTESKASAAHSELAVAFQKLLQIVEAFAQETGSDFTASTYSQLDAANSEISLHLKWNNTSLNNTMCNLALVGNRVLQGKSDVIHFIKEMVTALEFISVLKPQVRSTNCLAISEAHEELERVQERFAAVDEELERLRIEKAEIESHLKEANNQVENLKAQLHQGERFIVTDRLVRHQQGGDSPDSLNGRKEDELIEEELMVLSSPNPALRAASGELSKLHDKVAVLERELHTERQRHQSVAAKFQDLQPNVNERGGGHAVSSEMSGFSPGDLSSHSTSEEDEDTKSQKVLISDAIKQERQEREIAAAALAECQRTILALGKQLQGLGNTPALTQSRELVTQPSPNLSSMESVTSIEKMTGNMEFLRWQTEAAEHLDSPAPVPAGSASNSHKQTPTSGHKSTWSSPNPRRANRSASPSSRRMSSGNIAIYPQSVHYDSSFYVRSGENGLGFATRPPSPALSDLSGHGSGSIPGSPLRSDRSPTAGSSWPSRTSLETAITATDQVLAGEAELMQDVERNGEKQLQSPSNFSQFYSRSRSESSTSSQ